MAGTSRTSLGMTPWQAASLTKAIDMGYVLSMFLRRLRNAERMTNARSIS